MMQSALADIAKLKRQSVRVSSNDPKDKAMSMLTAVQARQT